MATTTAANSPIFLVGSGRSGTTLLRLMLDSHARIAIPPEAQFVVALSSPRLRLHRRPERAADMILAHPRFSRWGLDERWVRDRVKAVRPQSYSEVVQLMFSLFSESHGKQRWGDKTPSNVEFIGRLARLFPDAKFVHIVRDGRAVAASVIEQPWGPRTMVAAAWWWQRRTLRGRRAGRRLGAVRYLEVRLEDLVHAPEDVLRGVCAFLGEDWDPNMLEYYRTAEERLPWLASVCGQRHRALLEPPRAETREWRSGLSARQQRAVTAACRRGLRAFGYPVGRVGPAAVVSAWAGWLRAFPSRARTRITPLLHPSRADF